MALTVRHKLVCIALYICLLVDGFNAQLQVGFYNVTCPQAEDIVRKEVVKAIASDPGLAAGLLRLHFHDCFVRGCDASIMLVSYPWNEAEMDAIPNKSLRGFEIIWYAKWWMEQLCPGIVSCADIIAFAARDSVELTGGFRYDVPSGRRDGNISRSSEALSNLPPPFADVNTLTQMFANKGLDQDDMVTLSGAHTIGQSHCSSFSSRLNNFSPNSSTDPTLNSTLASQLNQTCSQNSSSVVPMDPVTPNTFDINYYKNLLTNNGLFQSDQTLMSNNATSSLVNQYAQDSQTFMSKFANAMIKMGNISVLTGTAGEIRTWCHVTN